MGKFVVVDALWITRQTVVDTEHKDWFNKTWNWTRSTSREGKAAVLFHP
jgi:hypothetical protein